MSICRASLMALTLVAAIAALVWNANPALPNIGVESILKASCFRAGGAVWTPYFGFGMPDAESGLCTFCKNFCTYCNRPESIGPIEWKIVPYRAPLILSHNNGQKMLLYSHSLN